MISNTLTLRVRRVDGKEGERWSWGTDLLKNIKAGA